MKEDFAGNEFIILFIHFLLVFKIPGQWALKNNELNWSGQRITERILTLFFMLLRLLLGS